MFKIQNIKEHPWFANISFDKILEKEAKAPFIPIIKHEIDVSNFDREFTECDVDSCCSSFSENKTLDGFSFEKSPMIQPQKSEVSN